MIEVHAEFPQREVIQANAVVDNEEKTVSEVIISAKPEITGVTASVDNETGTPYVDITETGTGTEFSFDLAFHNLKGDKGEQGEQGEPGQDGQDGTDGTDGQDGFSPIATVEPIQDGAKITITDKDGTTTTNVYNGTDGTDGADGQAATVTVGTTTTGAAGTNASVVNSGTSSAAVFDFVIPRGDKGDKGDKGDTGSQGPQGVQGEQGPQGIQGPKGETGATGQDGYSPTANVTQSGDITTITITDKNGTTTESIDLSDFGKVKSVNNTQPDANGDVTIQTGGATDVQINGTSITSNNVANILTETAYNSSTNKIATMSDVPSITHLANKNLDNLSATGESHFLKNIAGGTNSLSILAYGNVNGNNATSIGVNSIALGNGSISLGTDASNYAQNSIAIGYQANVDNLCDSAIQLGYGTNSTAKSFSVGFYDYSTPTNYQLLDGTTGLIPDARLSTNIARTSDIPSTSTFEQVANKVTSISSSSTNTQYPSAKLLYDQLALKQSTSSRTNTITSSSTSAQYPSASAILDLLKTIYPVGSVYLSTNSTCPLSSLFGTWSLVSSGRALWTGTGSNGNTTIAAGLPNIRGGVTQHKTTHTSGSSFSDGALAETYNKTGGGYSSSNSKNVYDISFNAASSNSIYSDSVTTVQPPAYVVNVWRRTA